MSSLVGRKSLLSCVNTPRSTGEGKVGATLTLSNFCNVFIDVLSNGSLFSLAKKSLIGIYICQLLWVGALCSQCIRPGREFFLSTADRYDAPGKPLHLMQILIFPGYIFSIFWGLYVKICWPPRKKKNSANANAQSAILKQLCKFVCFISQRILFIYIFTDAFGEINTRIF